MEAGGTWLGVNIKTGIMVVLTNYRQYLCQRRGKSRGLLVRYFLGSGYIKSPEQSPAQLSEQLYRDMSRMLTNPTHFSPHNLMIYNIRDAKMFYMCSETKMVTPYVLSENRVHGFSNTDINSKWTKVERGKKLFDGCLDNFCKREGTNE